MDTITEYIRWLGHETFDIRPFNDIDNLVLCQLTYYGLGDAFADHNVIKIGECVTLINKKKLKVHSVGNNGKNTLFKDFYEAVINAPRYKDILISDYIDIVSNKMQFCAMTFHISDHRAYVAYRGTDDTLIGWKEDFMISFTKIPAQNSAAGYLDMMINKYPNKDIIVGGHSKGGNLALYAVLFTQRENLSRIEHIYMNDAPGICDSVVDTSLLDDLKDRITKIKPEFSVVGRLFEVDASDEKILKCTETGVMQHMLLTWGIDFGQLYTVKCHTPESNWISNTLDSWIGNIPNDRRQQFVEEFFAALAKNGAKTLSDISGNGLTGFEQVLVNLTGADKAAIKTAVKLPERAIFGTTLEKIRNNVNIKALTKSRRVQGIAAIIAGLMFLIIPETNIEYFFMLFMTFVMIIMIGRTLYHLYLSKWNLYQERTMVFITIIAFFICQFIYFKEHALFIFSNIFLGVVFLMWSYNCACVLKSNKNMPKWVRARYWIEMPIFVILGLFEFVSPQATITTYAVSVGGILIIDGISRLIEYYKA